jgi:hypothetical protein
MEMLTLIKKGVFIQQQLFRVISVLKIKGQFITLKLFACYLSPYTLFSGRIFSNFHFQFVRYFKSVISTTLIMAVTI